MKAEYFEDVSVCKYCGAKPIIKPVIDQIKCPNGCMCATGKDAKERWNQRIEELIC